MCYIYIGVGGFFGAITRYAIGRWLSQKWNGSFPIGTFLINLSGAFALGLLVVVFTKFLPTNGNAKIMLTTGFLGTYTTFSTFTYETINLLENGEYIQVARYVILTMFLGILLSFGAVLIGEHI